MREELATLFPSPTKASRSPVSRFLMSCCQTVGQGLAGMTEIGQAVDDRNRGQTRKAFHEIVRERANHQPVHQAVERSRHVFERLPLVQTDFLGTRSITLAPSW
jgi:hypothetical protein